jgi:hypothetical protein
MRGNKMIKNFMVLVLILFFSSTGNASVVTVYSNTTDGSIHQYGATWSTVRSAATGNSVRASASYGAGANDGAIAFEYSGVYYISRVFLDFTLTGPLRPITSVKLYMARKDNDYVGAYVSVQQGTQGIPLTTADFDAFSGSYFAITSGYWDSPDDENYRTFTFNSTGRAYIKSVLGDTAKICVREYTNDYYNQTPSGVGRYVNYIYYAENTGTSKDPYLEITFPPYISGTLKEHEGDASGAAYSYLILDITDNALQYFGTAASDGYYAVETDDKSSKYCGIMIDNIGGAEYSGYYGTATTSNGSWSITNANWAENDIVWAFFVDPDEVYKTIGAKFIANSSHQISGIHKENGTNATGTMVFAFGFGNTEGTHDPKPIFDFVTGED